MEPNKLEQDIKQKLQERTIKPSPMAWDRLDAMLTIAEQEEQKVIPLKKKKNNWLYMAACFLVLLTGGFFFINRETQSTPENTTDGNTIVKNTAIDTVKKSENEIAPIQQQLAENKPAIRPAKKPETVKSFVEASKFIPLPEEKVAENNTVVTNNASQNIVIPNVRVSADELLASVDKGTVNSPEIKQPKLKVDANSLLSSVEGELDQSFRTKVLNSIERNYNAVKTAVATRNRQ